MGTKRVGLARVETLLKSLLKKDSINNRDFGYYNLGLSMPWVNNFGAGTAAADATSAAVPSTSNAVLYNLSLVLEHICERSEVVSEAEAESILGNSSAPIGVDKSASDTTGDKLVNLTVCRLTGNVASSVVYANNASDLASAGDSALIVFKNNVVTASQTITIGMHTNNELDAESFEIVCTGAGDQILTRQAATTDDHQDIILTASAADTTILAGSYLYFRAGNNTDVMTVKGCIRTTGGTITVSTAN